ncbi:hypothetical protein BOX15_Mlig017052g1 [Macrostomum lignano]|uniref:ETS domain-containing protein n=1 Tax=Macrostomum lignano TaxID=282301 RepID=A0A267GLW7_9PLAT|nr:hypothetical protein BOX15_Mlig017052g1 [Macrostomum lignano]
MDSDDIIEELLNGSGLSSYPPQQQRLQHCGGVPAGTAVFSALQSDAFMANCSENYSTGLGYCSSAGFEQQKQQQSTSRLAFESAMAAQTADDLNGLNTWDFAVMRSEFGDLQSIDNAELIDLYCRPNCGPDSQKLIDLTDEDSQLLELRSRSDSGYSTASCQQQQFVPPVASATTAASFWCQSPTCLSCASSSDGADSPSPPSLLSSPIPQQQLQQLQERQEQRSHQLAALAAKRLVSAVAAAPAAGGVVKRAKKQRTKVTKSRQLQLWQFLYQQLDLGTEADCLDETGQPNLHWLNRQDGVFRISNPNNLAEAWGKHRRRDNMTYEKMSRTLRYYYDRRLITKVTGKQHTYQFHYDEFPEQE